MNKWNIGLWVAQAVLAAVYVMAGFMKLTQPIDALVASGMSYAGDYPEMLTRFIGTMEVLGAIGIILPAATRIAPFLTPLAALGFYHPGSRHWSSHHARRIPDTAGQSCPAGALALRALGPPAQGADHPSLTINTIL
ncbi:MAG: DoxX family protein [Devosia sp.]